VFAVFEKKNLTVRTVIYLIFMIADCRNGTADDAAFPQTAFATITSL
jgi:hypothetical protein